jgi:protein SCO1
MVTTTVACGGGTTAPKAHGSSGSSGLRGITLSRPRDVSAVSLPDATNGGAPFVMKAPANGLLLAYFGYTSCPDICPTTLSDLRSALKRLGGEASRVELAMVSIDPKRDTADVLASYVKGFVPAGHALRTDDPMALGVAAKPFGAEYRVDVKPDGTEDVSHSSFVYVVNPAGMVVLQWSFGTPVNDLVHDMRLLLDQQK